MEKETSTQTGGENTGKTFTQEEVNQIIGNRLKEEREKMKKEQDATFAELEQKIAAREMRLNAIDKLREKGLPSSLVDAINCSSDETMNKSIDILMQTYKTEQGEPHRPSYHPVGGTGERTDPIREAMGLTP